MQRGCWASRAGKRNWSAFKITKEFSSFMAAHESSGRVFIVVWVSLFRSAYLVSFFMNWKCSIPHSEEIVFAYFFLRWRPDLSAINLDLICRRVSVIGIAAIPVYVRILSWWWKDSKCKISYLSTKRDIFSFHCLNLNLRKRTISGENVFKKSFIMILFSINCL